MLLFFRVLSALVLLLAVVGCANQKGTDYDYACRCTSEEETQSNGSCSTCIKGECSSCLDWQCDDGFSDVDADPSNGCEAACSSVNDYDLLSASLGGLSCEPLEVIGKCLSCENPSGAESEELTCTKMDCIAGYFDADLSPLSGCEKCPEVADATCTVCEFMLDDEGQITEPLRCTELKCEPHFVNLNGIESTGCELECRVEGVANGTCTSCFGTTCTSVTCDNDHLDLDEDASNGCEFACETIQIDDATCKKCSMGLPSCTGLECDTHFVDDDARASTGCELKCDGEEVKNGSCTSCPEDGICVSVTCDENHLDLDEDALNGCEFACETIQVDHAICKKCSNDLPDLLDCLVQSSGCTDLECLDDYTDTDGQVANGCETAPQTGG